MNVFLSYSQKDREWAKAVAERLQSADFMVWDSETDLYPGDNFALKIAEALENADAMVVFISPDSLASEWVKHEIEFALGSTRLSGRLIPVVVRPTEKLPWILQKLKTITPGGGPWVAADSVVQVLRQAD
ncbi:Toll/interleukin-1 receptor domain-containing protein [Gammaproteobacteria bacterium]